MLADFQLDTSKILVGNDVQGKRLEGFKRPLDGPLGPGQRPQPGDRLVFQGKRRDQQIETSPITHVRSATDRSTASRGYRFRCQEH